MQLQPHQQRVIVERDELSVKLAKLIVFIKSNDFAKKVQDERERGWLTQQKDIMSQYLDILNERIDAFK